MPPPSGMCTSSSTTSGRVLGDRRDGLLDPGGLAGDLEQGLELRADTGPEELVVVDDQHARLGHDRLPEQQLHLGARAWRARDGRAPAVAPHAPDDRLAHAAAVVRTARRVEARPAVADEHLDPLRRPRRIRPPRSRRRTSPRSSSPRAQRPPRPRQRRREAHRPPPPPPPARRGAPPPRRRRPRARRPAGRLTRRRPPGQPCAQLALLAARQRGHLARVVGARCTIASVWSTESCRCAAISARSCERIRSARSLGERAGEPHDPGREDHTQRPPRRTPRAARRARRRGRRWPGGRRGRRRSPGPRRRRSARRRRAGAASRRWPAGALRRGSVLAGRLTRATGAR